MSKLVGVALALSALILASCSGSTQNRSQEPSSTASQTEQDLNADTEPTEEKQNEQSEIISAVGAYITLDQYEDSKENYTNSDVVLFFNATWCSTCKIARDNFESDLKSIPSNLAIVLVDFDTEKELRKKYGVTIQHTFIQIDKEGNQLTKWSGSVTFDQIAEKLV